MILKFGAEFALGLRPLPIQGREVLARFERLLMTLAA
jgi:hypothetical protein